MNENYANLYEAIYTRAKRDYIIAAKKLTRIIGNSMPPPDHLLYEMLSIENFFRRGGLGVLDDDSAEEAVRGLRQAMRDELRSKK